MKLDKNEIISAQVILMLGSGKTIGPDDRITAENIDDFSPPSNSYPTASEAFKTMGFEVGPLGRHTFSITAPAGTFESMFKTSLNKSENGGIVLNEGILELPLDHLPDDTRTIIQTVTFSEPPDFGPADYFQ